MESLLKSPQILIIDDHVLLLKGTVEIVCDRFPEATIYTAQTAQSALEQMARSVPDLAIADLSIPARPGDDPLIETGLSLLRQFMQTYPDLNLTIQSSNLKALVRLLPDLDQHHGGLTLVDKSSSIDLLLTRIEWALQGLTHTKDLQTDLEVKPEWLEVLQLAFQEGLQDKAIAETMCKSERMIRHYWSKIQDALAVYPEPGKNMRSVTQIRAREAGLID
ncbi:MAG: response regulator transcription factor [Limnothrix sp.]|nr:response regulator transcription factor [Limnothrix sp.]